MKETIAKLTSNTYLSVGLVVTIIGAALGLGTNLNEIANLKQQISEVKIAQKEMNQEWKEELKAIRTDQALIKESINELRVLLVANGTVMLKK